MINSADYLETEGTNSDGATVLPFIPALLQPATEAKGSISSAAIDYELTDGSVADEICYWRETRSASFESVHENWH